MAGCLMMMVAGGPGGTEGVWDRPRDPSLEGPWDNSREEFLSGGGTSIICMLGSDISDRFGTIVLGMCTGDEAGDSSEPLSSDLLSLAMSSSGSLSGYSSWSLRLSSSTSSFSFFRSRSSDSISRSRSLILRARADPERGLELKKRFYYNVHVKANCLLKIICNIK